LTEALPKLSGDMPEVLRGRDLEGVLLGYQQRSLLLCSSTPLAVIEKSRRIGLTWALAALAVLGAAKQKSAGGKNTFYIGYNLDMAREFVATCAMWAEAFGYAGAQVGEELFEDGKGRPVQAFRIEFGSGFKIVALPSSPRSLRGMQGQIILDEAAFHDELEEMIKAAMAMLIWGGQVVVVSTHDGVANPFNLLLDEVRAGRRKGEALTITFDQAIATASTSGCAWSRRSRADRRGQARLDRRHPRLLRRGRRGGAGLHPAAGAGSLAQAGGPRRRRARRRRQARALRRRPDVRRPRRGPPPRRRVIWGFELVGDVLWLRDRYEERNGVTFAAQDQAADDLFQPAAWPPTGSTRPAWARRSSRTSSAATASTASRARCC
jgi:hypothetical protein